MKTAIAWIPFLVALSPANLSAQEPLNNETVLKLVKAGIGEETIVGMVNQQPGKYSLSADDIAALKTGGVSGSIAPKSALVWVSKTEQFLRTECDNIRCVHCGAETQLYFAGSPYMRPLCR